MKHWLFLSFLALTPACIAVDTPPEDQPEQVSSQSSLESNIDGWCAATCERLSACPERCSCAGDTCTCRSGVGEDCAEECRDTLEDYLGHGDGCAKIGLDLMSCVDGIQTCDMLYADYDCDEPSSADALCERDDPPPLVPPAAPGGFVVCRSASGGGTAGAAGGANASAFSCETLYEECSDGARYQLVCNGTSEQATCNCFRSGMFTGSLETAPARCPSTSELNVWCGWQLDFGE